MTKAIMSAISSGLNMSEAFNLAYEYLAASNISVSTKPGLMLYEDWSNGLEKKNLCLLPEQVDNSE